MKQPYSLTKIVNLSFVATPITTVNISVAHPVQSIRVKACAYQAGTVGTVNSVYVISSLSNGAPLCMVSQDSTYSTVQGTDIEFKPREPIVVDGIYTFTLYDLDGTLSATSNSGAATDSVSLIVEFN